MKKIVTYYADAVDIATVTNLGDCGKHPITFYEDLALATVDQIIMELESLYPNAEFEFSGDAYNNRLQTEFYGFADADLDYDDPDNCFDDDVEMEYEDMSDYYTDDYVNITDEIYRVSNEVYEDYITMEMFLEDINPDDYVEVDDND